MSENNRKERIAAAVMGIQEGDLAAEKNKTIPGGRKRAEELKRKQIQNAMASFAAGCRAEDIAVLCDTTILDSGKKGILFSTEGMYYNDINFGRRKNPLPQPVKYGELRGAEFGKNEDYIVLTFQDGRREEIFGSIYSAFIAEALRRILAVIGEETIAKERERQEREKMVAAEITDELFQQAEAAYQAKEKAIAEERERQEREKMVAAEITDELFR